MPHKVRFPALMFAAALLLAGCAAASTIVSVTAMSYSTWTTSNVGAQDLPFSTLTNGTQTPVTLGSFTFSETGLIEHSNAFIGSSVTVTEPSGGETSMLIFLGDQPSYANASSFTLTFSDGSTASLPLGSYAISSSTPITSFTVTGNSAIALEDLWFVPTQQSDDPAPEAATILLTSAGLLILLGSGQRLAQKRIA